MAAEDDLLRCFLSVSSAPGVTIPHRFIPSPDGFGPRRSLAPNPLDCLRWVERVETIAEGAGAPLAALLRRRGGDFHWGQTYRPGDFGAAFLANYGWLEVFGSRGCFPHGTVAGGLLLLGAETHYPDHHHAAEEIYVPLTGGSLWRMGTKPFEPRAAGEVIHHAGDVSHAMRTGKEPLLALYLWRGGPLDQRSNIGVTPEG